MQVTHEHIDTLLKQARDLVHKDYPQSFALAKQVLAASIDANYPYGQGVALQVIGLNEAQMTTGLPEAPFKESVAILESNQIWDEYCKSLCFLAYSVGRKGRFRECETLLERAMAVSREHKLIEQEALAHTHMGNLLARRKLVARALQSFHHSLQLYESIGFDGRHALNGLATVYREMKQYDEAIKYLNRGIEIAKGKDFYVLVLAHGNRGLVLEEAGRTAEALLDLEKALEYAKKINDSRSAFQILSAIPRVHLLLKQPEKAKESIDHIFSLLTDETEDIFRAGAYQARSDYHQAQKEWRLAIDDLQEALVLANRAENIGQLKMIHKELSSSYKELGDLASALEHQRIYAEIVEKHATEQLDERIASMEDEHRQEQTLQQNEIFRLRNIDLTEANLALIDANKQKDRFLSILQHDVRQPISSIIGYANLMANGESDIAIPEVASIVEESARRLLRVMDDLIESARAGSLTVDRKAVNLTTLLRDVERIVRPLAEGKDISFTLIDDTDGKEFSLDPNKMYQALTNLTFNSIKFTPSGKGIALSAGVKADGSISFEVKDEGIGIPPSFLPRIFEGAKEFQRKGTLGESSSGLGLAITKNVVELHQGSITISSEEHIGTRVQIVLPGIE